MKVKPTDVAFVVNQTLTLTDAVNGKASLSVNMTMDV